MDLVVATKRLETLRASLVTALQVGSTPALTERGIRDLLCVTQGRELTTLKNLLDAGGDIHDLAQLLFDDVDDLQVREAILAHLRREVLGHPSGENKVLSDIDDTFFVNWKDTRHPKQTVYQGVTQFYRELDRGPGLVPGRLGDLTFVSARPMDQNTALTALEARGVATSAMRTIAFQTPAQKEAREAELRRDLARVQALAASRQGLSTRHPAPATGWRGAPRERRVLNRGQSARPRGQLKACPRSPPFGSLRIGG
ncbi:hypothetical protein KRR26_17845 [Corallococcus sp. M34]|uniref:hypothetical protein n=1 Tax=Citreicoccus inhibens TaxID=2849499 RepID=UPI001C23F193|nr:hypothetical protein [Citreicoccus inhibens]MBU8897484.1 hypothetical protein [Citreicoccus inhibens]